MMRSKCMKKNNGAVYGKEQDEAFATYDPS